MSIKTKEIPYFLTGIILFPTLVVSAAVALYWIGYFGLSCSDNPNYIIYDAPTLLKSDHFWDKVKVAITGAGFSVVCFILAGLFISGYLLGSLYTAAKLEELVEKFKGARDKESKGKR